jgi:hypothetical protein
MREHGHLFQGSAALIVSCGVLVLAGVLSACGTSESDATTSDGAIVAWGCGGDDDSWQCYTPPP